MHHAEQWETEEALHDHIRSDLYRRVPAAMALSRRQHGVKSCYGSESTGLELIETARREARQQAPTLDENQPETSE